jgi:hypothetical protein
MTHRCEVKTGAPNTVDVSDPQGDPTSTASVAQGRYEPIAPRSAMSTPMVAMATAITGRPANGRATVR